MYYANKLHDFAHKDSVKLPHRCIEEHPEPIEIVQDDREALENDNEGRSRDQCCRYVAGYS